MYIYLGPTGIRSPIILFPLWPNKIITLPIEINMFEN